MTYASGSVIQASDYNTLAGRVNQIWGTGTSGYGFGQPNLPVVVPGVNNPVTSAQWNNLITAINACQAHRGLAIINPAINILTLNDLVTYYGQIDTASQAVPTTASGTTALSLVTMSSTATTYSGAWGHWVGVGDKSLTFNQTVTFPSGDAARYFFNAGGQIKLNFSHSDNTDARNMAWTALCNAVGTISIGYRNTTKAGGSGTPAVLLNSNNGGYWSGTNVPVTHFLQYGATYTNHYILVQYWWSGTASNGGYPTVNIRTTWANPGSGILDSVRGNSVSTITVASPSTTYLTTESWGHPAVSGSTQHDIGGIEYSPGSASWSVPGTYSWTVPAYVTTLNIALAGGGGGGGGGDGGKVGTNGKTASTISGTMSVTGGQVFTFYVGGPGGGGAGGRSGSGYGTPGASSGGYPGGRGGNAGGSGSSGAGGGGGAATALYINGGRFAVAGGGGAGGGAGVGSWAATTWSWYAVSNGAWDALMNTYGVWAGSTVGASTTFSTSVYFPVSGVYRFYLSTDNSGYLYIDGSNILNSGTFQSNATTTVSIAAGYHTISGNMYNSGGPAGFAVQILNPSSVTIWHSRNLIGTEYSTGQMTVPTGGNGQDKPGDGGGAGGGGGGLLGGAGGTCPGGDIHGYSGTSGTSLVPGGFTQGVANNAGAGSGGNGGAGGTGWASISW